MDVTQVDRLYHAALGDGQLLSISVTMGASGHLLSYDAVWKYRLEGALLTESVDLHQHGFPPVGGREMAQLRR